MLGFWTRAKAGEGRTRPAPRLRLRPTGERLEGRELLATAGVDYVLSGYQWANPARITYSFAPDGVFWDHGTNTLNATFNAKFGAGAWQHEIARALATWESVANLNIVPVGDSSLPLDTFGQSQGDPRFGDIRFGGYDFSNNTSTLAQTYYPPPQGVTEAGDVEVNTAMNFSIGGAGGSYDLYSVLLHETGHALGLEHATNSAEVMSATYGGVRSGLAAGDIAGIDAIYGARTLDAFQSGGQGVNTATAIDVTASLDASRQATLPNVSLGTIGDTEYFSVVAPAGAGPTLQVTAMAAGVSMLSPKVTLMDASGTPIDTQSDASSWSDNVTAHASQVVPGRRYLIAVTGATGDVFAVGAYQLQVAFNGGASTPTPTPTPTPIQSLTPPPVQSPTATVPSVSAPSIVTVGPDRFENNNTFAQATSLGVISSTTTLANLTLTVGDLDIFSFQGSRAGIDQVVAPGTSIRVFDGTGQLVASGSDGLAIQVLKPHTNLFVMIASPTAAPVANYAVAIIPQSAAVAAVPAPHFSLRNTVVRRPRGVHRQVVPAGSLH